MIGKLVPIRNGEKKPKTDDISIMLNAVLQRKKKEQGMQNIKQWESLSCLCKDLPPWSISNAEHLKKITQAFHL